MVTIAVDRFKKYKDDYSHMQNRMHRKIIAPATGTGQGTIPEEDERQQRSVVNRVGGRVKFTLR
jgi:hypothetical protein